jgi:hypothetical protein
VRLDRRHLLLPLVLLVGWFVPGWLDRLHARHVLAHPTGRSSPLEQRLADVAEPIAGRRIEVRCADLSDASPVEPLGRVRFVAGAPVDYLELRHDACAALAEARRAPIRPCETDLCFSRVLAIAEAVKAPAGTA